MNFAQQTTKTVTTVDVIHRMKPMAATIAGSTNFAPSYSLKESVPVA
jgi:hypothetical protein